MVCDEELFDHSVADVALSWLVVFIEPCGRFDQVHGCIEVFVPVGLTVSAAPGHLTTRVLLRAGAW